MQIAENQFVLVYARGPLENIMVMLRHQCLPVLLWTLIDNDSNIGNSCSTDDSRISNDRNIGNDNNTDDGSTDDSDISSDGNIVNDGNIGRITQARSTNFQTNHIIFSREQLLVYPSFITQLTWLKLAKSMLMSRYLGELRFVLNVKTVPSFVMYCDKKNHKQFSTSLKSLTLSIVDGSTKDSTCFVIEHVNQEDEQSLKLVLKQPREMKSLTLVSNFIFL